VSVITIGRRGRDWVVRHGLDIVADVSQLGDRPTLLDTSPAARVVIDGYEQGRFDAVHLVYNRFVSTTVQRVEERQLLPVEPAGEVGRHFAEYIFEPDPATVLGQLLPRLIEVQVYQTVLESLASEHSARMVAMHNATQNAHEVIQELTLSYNKARQSGITKEILEISSGAEALQRG
jgi:F-type H+-transporting ATPase subunit gamma